MGITMRLSVPDYVPDPQTEIRKAARDILASIYYDINQVCLMRVKVVWDPTEENAVRYRSQFQESEALMDMLVAPVLDPETYDIPDPSGTVKRLEEFMKRFRFRLLAMCSLAEGFRRACCGISDEVWAEFLHLVKENQRSLNVFARTRDLDWQGPLLKYAKLGVKVIDEALRPSATMSNQHPHHNFLNLDEKVKRPKFSKQQQIHVDEYVIDPLKWKGKHPLVDPTLRIDPYFDEEGYYNYGDGHCDICGSRKTCACELDFLPGSLLELVEREGTGTGVRTLAKVRKDDMLGHFIGEICPPGFEEEETYSLSLKSKTTDGFRAVITPAKYGNWTRFMAHSCKNNVEFVPRTVGKRIVMAIEATRDIEAFEDIKISYGDAYWEGKTCLCGEDNCISKRKKTA
ncbi:hypothetical protein BJY04DRAFT_230597 [Aspergillus karnatakaensis]|uniref:SET domain protein n=1 Tax=Aspergillus karnatakaensis TaxID=1810916 RepID=UPI003CCE335C